MAHAIDPRGWTGKRLTRERGKSGVAWEVVDLFACLALGSVGFGLLWAAARTGADPAQGRVWLWPLTVLAAAFAALVLGPVLRILRGPHRPE